MKKEILWYFANLLIFLLININMDPYTLYKDKI